MITLHDAVEYELRGSWWASWVFWGWGQELTARYFVWKARKKHTRYVRLGGAN